jgi:hypothetical protein
MKKHKAATGQFVNLTSLVDVVSMNVGILVILAVFMALLAVFSSSQQPGSPSADAGKGADGRPGAAPAVTGAEPPVARLRVPWSHPTNKQTLFFVVRGNRVQYVDFKAVYEQLLRAGPAGQGAPLTLSARGFKTRFFPISNQVYCMEISPDAGSGETWQAARSEGSIWRRVQAKYSRENFIYFFWVGGDSFELFRDLRKTLVDGQVEVGWKPIGKKTPLEVCNGFEGSSTFQPQ